MKVGVGYGELASAAVFVTGGQPGPVVGIRKPLLERRKRDGRGGDCRCAQGAVLVFGGSTDG